MTTQLSGKTFADSVEQGIVLVDWWASWCGPCRAFAPIYERVSARHPDVVFAKIDVDREVELASAFEIRSIPTLMAFRDGVLVFRQAGALSGEALERLVQLVRDLDMAAVLERAAR